MAFGLATEDDGININIVECKCWCLYWFFMMYFCININIVECK